METRVGNSVLSAPCSERFHVLPLWSWSLAAAEIKSSRGTCSGFGFDRDATFAKVKAISEAIERSVYYSWEDSGISPFDGVTQLLPPLTAGFAAHPDRLETRMHAFLEWRERAGLFAASNSRLKFKKIQVPKMGFLFSVGLRMSGCELNAWIMEDSPMIAFALAKLKSGGVIFGSACHPECDQAVEKAVAECLRKMAFVPKWRSTSESSPFLSMVKFWLSPVGARRAQDFLVCATTASLSTALPTEPKAQFLKEMQREGLWICSYWDPEYELPEPDQLIIPIL